MLQRIALLCFSLLLIASGTASAAQADCPSAKASQMVHAMAADCDMGMMEHAPADVPDEPMDGMMDNAACCCPAIVAALPAVAAGNKVSHTYPPLFDAPLDASPVSITFVPEPPPPRV